ncbi:MAG: hypothetical protein WA705_04080 [Candidatus Ozemobacteraceae bacterium]
MSESRPKPKTKTKTKSSPRPHAFEKFRKSHPISPNQDEKSATRGPGKHDAGRHAAPVDHGDPSGHEKHTEPGGSSAPRENSHGTKRPEMASANQNRSHGTKRPEMASANQNRSHGTKRPGMTSSSRDHSQDTTRPENSSLPQGRSHGTMRPKKSAGKGRPHPTRPAGFPSERPKHSDKPTDKPIEAERTGNRPEASSSSSGHQKHGDRPRSPSHTNDRPRPSAHADVRPRTDTGSRNAETKPRNTDDRPGNTGDRSRNTDDRPRNGSDRSRDTSDRPRKAFPETREQHRPASRQPTSHGAPREASVSHREEALSEDQRPTRFCFEGDYSAPTASGRMTRELVLAARGHEMPLSLRERKSYGPRFEEPLPPFLEQLIRRPPSGRIRILCMPAFALPENVDRGEFWAISGFDPIHPTPLEIAALKRVEKLWVPSAAHRKALQKAGMPAMKLEIMPPAVNRKIFHSRAEIPDEIARRSEKPGEKTFRFLAVVNPLRRKGVDLILRAYLEEFKPDESVHLVLKMTHLPKLKKDFPYEISDLAKRLGALNRMFARVDVFAETWTDNKLAGLMAGCNAFVTANRAYHTAMVVREAMAAGLPIIGPTCLTDILELDETTGYLVSTREVSMEEGGLFADSPETMVEEVEIEALRKRMREAFTDQRNTREKGMAAIRAGRTAPDWKNLAGRLLAAVPASAVPSKKHVDARVPGGSKNMANAKYRLAARSSSATNASEATTGSSTSTAPKTPPAPSTSAAPTVREEKGSRRPFPKSEVQRPGKKPFDRFSRNRKTSDQKGPSDRPRTKKP